MLIYLDINIPHLKIAHLGGNLEVGNIEIHLESANILYQRNGWGGGGGQRRFQQC